MRKNIKEISKLTAIITLFFVLTACGPSPTPDLSTAGTYAAQTLEALPTATATEAPKDLPTPTPTVTFEPTPLPIAGPVGPSDFPEDVNPLTGLRVEDTDLLERRPVLVKVANYPPSGRPHAGLSLADMVFEYYIGSGMNRFTALFYGQNAEKIGPMRSGRLVDPKITSLYEGVLGFQAAYVTVLDRIYEVLGERALNGAAGICPAICDDGRNIVTSVFGNSAALTVLADERGVDNRKYDLEGMAFDPMPPDGGEEALQAAIQYVSFYRSEWRYDPDSGYYLSWIDDASIQDFKMIPLTDRLTDQQLAFSNVIVLFAEYTEFAPTLHDVDLWNVTGQRAMVFRDGNVYDVTWTTPATDQPIQFLDAEGEILPLKPGNTWVVIFGQSSGVTEDEGIWTFNFRIP